MVPAMDRSTSTPRRRAWINFGFGLALCASQAGCAELKAQIFGDPTPPGVIGRPDETHDTYASGHQVKPPTEPGATYVNGVETPDSVIARADEVGMSIHRAEAPADDSVSGVSLQPPIAAESRANLKAASATTGVPNTSRILASAERRPDPSNSTKPNPAELIGEARAALNAMSTYQVVMHRQERANSSLQPEEDVVLAVRRSPRAVRLTWPSGSNQGREVLYRADEPGGAMHIKLPNPALPRLTLNPLSPIVMKNSRHPVTEAGFDSLVEGLENALNAPPAVGISYKGVETPPGLDRPAHCLVRTTPSGENWKVYLDTQNHLPSLIEAVDGQGALLERYVFLDVQPNLPELATNNAFDPTARWGQPKGLLSRLTGGGGTLPTAEASPR